MAILLFTDHLNRMSYFNGELTYVYKIHIKFKKSIMLKCLKMNSLMYFVGRLLG